MYVCSALKIVAVKKNMRVYKCATGADIYNPNNKGAEIETYFTYADYANYNMLGKT